MDIFLKDQLRDLLPKSEERVLQELRGIFRQNDNNFKQVFLLNMRLKDLKQQVGGGLLSMEESSRTHNQIRSGILDLIDLITPEEAAAHELENAIFQKLLVVVVCKIPEREAEMRRLFPKNYYKQVEFDTSGHPLPEEYVNQFDLVIFDNFPHGEKDDPQDLLRYYLEKTKPYVLYFGAQLNLLWQFPEKAYFANSIFSIHARLEEMIKYVKYTQKREG